MSQNRKEFRETCLDRDDEQCLVPWCINEATEVHHILERELWNNGGYIPNNGASVCNKHHRYAESNDIPPQAFWMWIGVENPPLPKSIQTKDVDKWGKEFEKPPWETLREYHKYPSSRHLLPLYWYEEKSAKERIENDDTELSSLEEFVGIPLVITEKIDGGNCLLVSDIDNPVRARNGSTPEDTMKPLYRDDGLYWKQEVNQKLPDRLQVFGEWVYAKHSIHYGCDCETKCDDVGPSLSELTGINDERAYFQVFGVYDTKLNLWLSWPETERVAERLGFPTTPVLYEESKSDEATFESETEARRKLLDYAHDVVSKGGEGIVIRSKYPFHYGQFEYRLGKYVRENHVDDDEDHWKHKEKIINQI